MRARPASVPLIPPFRACGGVSHQLVPEAGCVVITVGAGATGRRYARYLCGLLRSLPPIAGCDIIHNFSAAINGRETDFRDLLTRLDTFVGALDAQRDNIVASIQGLNQLASTFAGQRDVITRALEKIPPALDVVKTRIGFAG